VCFCQKKVDIYSVFKFYEDIKLANSLISMMKLLTRQTLLQFSLTIDLFFFPLATFIRYI
jgi:hypothetical protein